MSGAIINRNLLSYLKKMWWIYLLERRDDHLKAFMSEQEPQRRASVGPADMMFEDGFTGCLPAGNGCHRQHRNEPRMLWCSWLSPFHWRKT